MLLIDTKQVLNSGQLPEHALLVVWTRQCRATTGSTALDALEVHTLQLQVLVIYAVGPTQVAILHATSSYGRCAPRRSQPASIDIKPYVCVPCWFEANQMLAGHESVGSMHTEACGMHV